MKLGELKHNAKNPRKITDPKLEMLRKSLEEFGDLSGIVFNRVTGNLVGGHQRSKVLPLDAQIVITQDYGDKPTRSGTIAEGHVVIAGEKFKYREVEFDEQKETAAMIAANKHGGEWDFPVLNDLLLELDQESYAMDLTGFDLVELEKQFTHVSAHERSLSGAEDDWEGMPEFNQEDKTSFRHVIVHFNDQDAVDEFFKAINQSFTDKTKSVWFPPQERMDTESKRYAEE